VVLLLFVVAEKLAVLVSGLVDVVLVVVLESDGVVAPLVVVVALFVVVVVDAYILVHLADTKNIHYLVKAHFVQ
jgi:hypothetical protein